MLTITPCLAPISVRPPCTMFFPGNYMYLNYIQKCITRYPAENNDNNNFLEARERMDIIMCIVQVSASVGTVSAGPGPE